MDNYIEKLYQELREEVLLYQEMGARPVRRISGALAVARDYLGRLNAHIEASPFSDESVEIAFYKYELPRFAAEQYFALEMLRIELERPPYDAISIRDFFTAELKRVKGFFAKHAFLYTYFQLDGNDLDQLLFLAGKKVADFLLPEITDALFKAPGSQLFARFIAFERLQEYLLRELVPKTDFTKPHTKLSWTGDKMNLMELAYGIYDTMQLNNGNVDIIDIITWLEESLRINLSRHYRMFSEMKSRKLVSPTRYLDHMREMLQRHLADGDAFVPKAPKSVSGSKSS